METIMKIQETVHEHKTQMNRWDQMLQSLPSRSYNMINVGKKVSTSRCALAQGKIFVGEDAFMQIKNKTMPKGDPLVLSEIAGINGAKCAYQFIPLCHPLNLEQVIVYTVPNEEEYSIMVYCLASAFAKTGVEMEALAGVNAALLSIYDLCKIVNADLSISNIRLLFKQGGKSGLWIHSQGIPEELRAILDIPQQPLANIRTKVFEMSDRAYRGAPNYPDVGIFLKSELEKLGASPVDYELLPDDKDKLKQNIKQAATDSYDLIMLHGGTGISSRDITSAAVAEVADRILPGIGELLRKYGESYTPYSWLSCSIAAVVQRSLVVAIPGSKNAIYESMSVLPNILAKAVHELHRP
jgi:cyclic pyranopterin monophosphate synthase